MNKVLFDIPVLLIVHNRPETTYHVFEQIRNIKPAKLYIFSDAPKEGKLGDADLVETCRCLMADAQINWECMVERWYPTAHMGWAIGVSSAITWAFETCEKLVILQDDLLPHPSFFTFCKTMLDKYEADAHVMHVSGTCWEECSETNQADHSFSLIGHVWGWATWKRAWSKYDFWMEQLPEMKNKQTLKGLFGDTDTVKYWHDRFDQVYEQLTKRSWDYQWQYTLFQHNGIAVVPNVNLVSNIGFERSNYGIKLPEHYISETAAWQAAPKNVQTSMDSAPELLYTKKRDHSKPGLRTRIVTRFRRMLQSDSR
ncbi:hypothetical protein [Dyadobacter sp. CY326]|uniref:hypothetical protein n=1 Tax=Dyadobacter sp. CY326 TaxID=2907300 RepID=UPI001F1ECF1A|nr:hypothetical protein [Dyadobacter sp. CY326]MCE7066599.1 hypothetical protein [Dyadobacter sp. CY326]